MSKFAAFEQMGGRRSLVLINKVFYDKIYKHPWMKQFFENIPQHLIEAQQVDFMQKVLGGENIFMGRTPPKAHMHIMINEEIFQVRKQLLQQAFAETNAKPELIQKWLALDDSFKRVLFKDSVAKCQRRFNSDDILDFPNPDR